VVLLAGSIPTKVGRPKKDRVEGQGAHPVGTGRVQRRQDGPGAPGLGLDPVPQRRLVEDRVGGQEHTQERFAAVNPKKLESATG
jgi:hypothetical protein